MTMQQCQLASLGQTDRQTDRRTERQTARAIEIERRRRVNGEEAVEEEARAPCSAEPPKHVWAQVASERERVIEEEAGRQTDRQHEGEGNGERGAGTMQRRVS